LWGTILEFSKGTNMNSRIKERLAYKILMMELNGEYSQAAFLRETGKRLVDDKFNTSKRKLGTSYSVRNYYDEKKFWND